jgi:hypothetical protein
MIVERGLGLVRTVHTAIYLVMAFASLVVAFAALTGRQGVWLWFALTLVGVESAVFIGFGMKCPLTALAVKYGASPQRPADTFLPKSITRHTLAVFGPMIALSVILLAVRWIAG